MDKEVAHIEGEIRLGRKKEGALFIGSDAGGPGGCRAEQGESGRGRRRPEDLTRTWSLKDKTNTRNRDKLAEAESVPGRVNAGGGPRRPDGQLRRGLGDVRSSAGNAVNIALTASASDGQRTYGEIASQVTRMSNHCAAHLKLL